MTMRTFGLGCVNKDDDGDAASHTIAELKTIELFSLTTVNLLTDNSGYNVITLNDGSIVYSPTIG